jgi:DNA-binding transcriptional LysR family regulator
MPEAFSRFLSSHPKVDLSLKLLPVSQVMSRVALQQADLGLMHGPLNDDSIVGEKLYDGAIICALPACSPLAEKACIHLDEPEASHVLREVNR